MSCLHVARRDRSPGCPTCHRTSEGNGVSDWLRHKSPMALLISLTCILYMVRLHGVPCRSEPQPKRSARSAAGAHGARPRVAASSSSSSTRPCLRSKSCGVAAPVRCFGVSVFQRRAASAQPPPRMSDRPAPAVKPSGGSCCCSFMPSRCCWTTAAHSV